MRRIRIIEGDGTETQWIDTDTYNELKQDFVKVENNLDALNNGLQGRLNKSWQDGFGVGACIASIVWVLLIFLFEWYSTPDDSEAYTPQTKEQFWKEHPIPPPPPGGFKR